MKGDLRFGFTLRYYVDLTNNRNRTILINGRPGAAQEWVLQLDKKDRLPRGKRFDIWRNF